MMPAQILKTRHVAIDELPGVVRVTIHAPKRWRPIGYSAAIVLMWLVVMGLIALFMYMNWNREFNGPFVLVGLWVLGFTVAGLSRGLALAWDLVGIQVVEFDPQFVTIRHDLFGWGDARQYLAEHVVDMRTSHWLKPYEDRVRKFAYPCLIDLANTPLAFDYGAETIRFGNNLDESDARQILDVIHSRFPQYRPV